MANKYIIEGAAFNGDGTSSAEATVEGGVGAWNTIAYFEGATPAYGSLAAGDTVYIRSKTAAGADMTRSLPASGTLFFGSTLATRDAPVGWVLDDGSVWPEAPDGVLTYTKLNNGNSSLRDNNVIDALGPDRFVFIVNSAGSSTSTFTALGGAVTRWLSFDMTASMTYGSNIAFGSSTFVVMENTKIRARSWYQQLIGCPQYGRVVFTNLTIELVAGTTDTEELFNAGQYGGSIEVYGGRLFGEGVTPQTVLGDIVNGRISFFGFEFPRFVKLLNVTTIGGYSGYTNMQGQFFEAVGCDGGSGTVYAEKGFICDSRSDGFYPTLNATFPSSTPIEWSYRIQPTYAHLAAPAKVKSAMLYTGASAAKTVSLEFLAASVYSPKRKNTWIDVIYIDDTTGSPTVISSRQPDLSDASVDSSTASWSAVTWGPVLLNRFALSVQTPTAIRQDTLVTVVFNTTLSSLVEDHVFFVCPEVSLT